MNACLPTEVQREINSFCDLKQVLLSSKGRKRIGRSSVILINALFPKNKQPFAYFPIFKSKQLQERQKIAWEHKLCFKCLKENLQASDCPNENRCLKERCGRLHHTLLHNENQMLMIRLTTRQACLMYQLPAKRFFLTFEIKCTYVHLTVSSLSIITLLSNLHMFSYDRYIVVLTKRAAKNLKVNNANENFLPSHCFLLRSSEFKCNFIDFFSQDTLRYITK